MFQATHVPSASIREILIFAFEHWQISIRTNGEATAPGAIFKKFAASGVKLSIHNIPKKGARSRLALAGSRQALVECRFAETKGL
jgi:hypothetical protein